MSEVLSLLNQNIQNAFNPKYSLLTRIDCLWAVFQFFSFFPMFLCTLHRFYNQIPHTPYIKDKKMKFPTNIVEYFVKFNTFMFVIFYILKFKKIQELRHLKIRQNILEKLNIKKTH